MNEENKYPKECMDLHVHSSYSSDGTASPKDILKRAKAIGLGGVAITDHNEIRGGVEALKLDTKGLVIVPGIEVTSASGGHILALGITEAVNKGLSTAETVENIEALGGIAIAPHPYRFWSGLGEKDTRNAGFHTVEVVNARSKKQHNDKARALAKDMGAGMTGGSDAHYLDHIGLGRTCFPTQPSNIDEALQMISKKETDGLGDNRKADGTIRYVYKSVTLWMGRGMKRI